MREVMVNLAGHHHPLLTENIASETCFECGEEIYELTSYYCKICNKGWHIKCMPTALEINHSCHPNHALKLLLDGSPHYTDGKCHFCRDDLHDVIYHCSTCNFTLDVKCAVSPKRVTIDESKCHNHPLTLMARQVSFVCNVCGMNGERNPYVCISCSFMVHEDCIDRPHVININRHNHRIFHTYSLGFGDRKCKVCRLDIDWMYGAYACPKCPNFVVHSKCATNRDVWDGEELEGIPEEEEDEPMFKVIGEGVINHLKHPSHNLRLIMENGVVRDEDVRCQLCDGLVYYSDNFYSCVDCDYVLHQKCAYLPKRTRLGFSSSRVSLEEECNGEFFKCEACKQFSTGFRYSIPNDASEGYVIFHRKKFEVDLRCASVDWSCDHESHPHTLFLTNLDHDTCGACGNDKNYVLRCVDCKFNLCYKCATFPKRIKHRCDDHPLVLSFGDKDQHGTYWCTVCEKEADPRKWFYECEDCGIVCHIHCVFGDFGNVKPGLFTELGKQRGVVLNNGVTRLHCSNCGIRCLVPFVYSVAEDYFCSYACLVPNSEFLEARRAENDRKRRVEVEIQEKTELKFSLRRQYLKSIR